MALTYDAEKITRTALDQGKTTHKIVTGASVMAQIVTTRRDPTKKMEVMPHRHNEEQIAYMLEGEGELVIESVEPKGNYNSLPGEFVGQPSLAYKVKAGMFFRIPSGALHSFKVIGDKQVSWLSMYNPVRPTYLPDAVRLETEESPLPYK